MGRGEIKHNRGQPGFYFAQIISICKKFKNIHKSYGQDTNRYYMIYTDSKGGLRMNNLLTTKQLAEKLQVAEITIRKWREKGLPFIKLGRAVRFDESEVIAWIKEKNNL